MIFQTLKRSWRSLTTHAVHVSLSSLMLSSLSVSWYSQSPTSVPLWQHLELSFPGNPKVWILHTGWQSVTSGKVTMLSPTPSTLGLGIALRRDLCHCRTPLQGSSPWDFSQIILCLVSFLFLSPASHTLPEHCPDSIYLTEMVMGTQISAYFIVPCWGGCQATQGTWSLWVRPAQGEDIWSTHSTQSSFPGHWLPDIMVSPDCL